MAKTNALSVPPPAALPAGEANPYVAKYKTALAKNWKLTSGGTVREIANLAIFLWALGRPSEALEVAESVTGSLPAPPQLPRGGVNYDLWYSAVICHALVAHLAPKAAQAIRSREAILGDCGLARNNPSYLVEMVTEAQKSAAAPAGQDTIKWASLGRARAIGSMVLFLELAKGRDTLFMPHEPAATAALPELLAKLGERLTKGK